MLPPGRECNPAHSGVPGPVRDPAHAQDIPKASQHEIQSHPQQPKWTSKGMPSNLQWDTNGQQLAIHRSIESSYHRILSLGAGGRGAKPFRYIKRCGYIYLSLYIYVDIYIYMPQTTTPVKVGVLTCPRIVIPLEIAKAGRQPKYLSPAANSLEFQDCWSSPGA